MGRLNSVLAWQRTFTSTSHALWQVVTTGLARGCVATMLVVRRPEVAQIRRVQRGVLSFYVRHARRLPWRRTKDAYHILVSEVMLQQTQVQRVVRKYDAFLARFPTLTALAAARFCDVLRAWLGLGYNGRALRLWKCARMLASGGGAQVPSSAEALRTLPGIGAYTAAAVACFAFDEQVPVVDTNVRRVLCRALAGADGVKPPALRTLALAALPRDQAANWAQGLMDIGARYCKARGPRCTSCPLRSACTYAATLSGARKPRIKSLGVRQPAFAGSRRFYRGRIMEALALRPRMRVSFLARQVKNDFGVSDRAWLDDLLAGLARDGLIRFEGAGRFVQLP